MQPTVNDRTMPTGYLLEKTGVVEGAYRWLLALEEADEELQADDRNLDRLQGAALAIWVEIAKWRQDPTEENLAGMTDLFNVGYDEAIRRVVSYAAANLDDLADAFDQPERIVFHTCPDCGGTTVEDLNDDDTLRDHADFTCTCDPWR